MRWPCRCFKHQSLPEIPDRWDSGLLPLQTEVLPEEVGKVPGSLTGCWENQKGKVTCYKTGLNMPKFWDVQRSHCVHMSTCWTRNGLWEKWFFSSTWHIPLVIACLIAGTAVPTSVSAGCRRVLAATSAEALPGARRSRRGSQPRFITKSW